MLSLMYAVIDIARIETYINTNINAQLGSLIFIHVTPLEQQRDETYQSVKPEENECCTSTKRILGYRMLHFNCPPRF